MRNTIIAGNWKMNTTADEAVALIAQVRRQLPPLPAGVKVIVCPPYTSLVAASGQLAGSGIGLGAQNVSQNDDGAYTGEVSVRMLTAAGVGYVILGHSERRQYFGETDQLVNAKVKKAMAAGLTPIICVGETLAERESGVTETVVSTQVKGVLAGIGAESMKQVIIAYEPVWAIGTGKNATPAQANDVHVLIRGLVAKLFDAGTASRLVIQYGGSMNAQNAASLLAEPDIDGGLIGGASLKSDAFLTIIKAAISAAG